MKNKNCYEEVILSTYASIDQSIDEIDKMVIKKAYGSFYSRKNVFDEADEIIVYLSRRNRLQNLKWLCEKVLSRLNDEEIQLLNYKYFDKPVNYGFDYFSRNYFRRQIRLMKKIGQYFKFIGLDEKTFIMNYADIPCVRSAAFRCKKRENIIDYDFEIKKAS